MNMRFQLYSLTCLLVAFLGDDNRPECLFRCL